MCCVRVLFSSACPFFSFCGARRRLFLRVLGVGDIGLKQPLGSIVGQQAPPRQGSKNINRAVSRRLLLAGASVRVGSQQSRAAGHRKPHHRAEEHGGRLLLAVPPVSRVSHRNGEYGEGVPRAYVRDVRRRPAARESMGGGVPMVVTLCDVVEHHA